MVPGVLLALSDCRLWLACPCSRPFFSSDLLRSAAFCRACLAPEDTWLCIFFSLPFSLVNGGPVISWNQSSQLHGHKIPWWLVMTLFVPAQFLLRNNFCLEGVTVGMSWHSFGSLIAESGAVETLGPFYRGFLLWLGSCGPLGQATARFLRCQDACAPWARWAGYLVPLVSTPGPELMMPFSMCQEWTSEQPSPLFQPKLLQLWRWRLGWVRRPEGLCSTASRYPKTMWKVSGEVFMTWLDKVMGDLV